MDFTAFFDYPGTGDAAGAEELVFLPNASSEEWARLLEHTEARPFAGGDVVVRQGTSEQALFIVTEGRLEVLVGGDGRGEARRIATIEPGSVFGEQSFFDGKPRSASVRALADGEIRSLTVGAFEVLAAKEPALARAILFDLARILSLRLRQTTARVSDLGA
jgi:CRP-like cAMP-binding protein